MSFLFFTNLLLNFREISPPCELFTSRLHVKDPSLTAQGVSQAKFRKKSRIIWDEKGRKENSGKIGVGKEIRMARVTPSPLG